MSNEDFIYNAPAESELDYTPEKPAAKSSSRRSRYSHIYQMRPTGQSPTPEDNTLLIPLFRPSDFKPFQGVVAPHIRAWFLRIPGHYVENHLPDGKVFSTFVLCKKEANAEYEKSYQNPLVLAPATCPTCQTVSTFRGCLTCGADLGIRAKDSACPQCDWASRQWSSWRAEWTALGFTNAARIALKNSNKELYSQYMAPGTALKGFQDEAASNMFTDRYLTVVLDVDKLMGLRQLGQDEPAEVALQLSFQSKSVLELLNKKFRAGKQFFDPRNKMTIVLTRDTRDGVRYTKYSIEDKVIREIPDEWVNYIIGGSGTPELGPDDLVVLPYEEHSRRAGLTLTQEELVPMQLVSPPIAPPARAIPAAPVLSPPPVAPVVVAPPPGPATTVVMPPPAATAHVATMPPVFTPPLPPPQAQPVSVVTTPPPAFTPPVPVSPPLPPVGGTPAPEQLPVMTPSLTPPPPATAPVIPGRVGMPTATAAPAPVSAPTPPLPPGVEGQRPRRQAW